MSFPFKKLCLLLPAGLLALPAVGGCAGARTAPAVPSVPDERPGPSEQSVRVIPLAGPLAGRDAEVSGLAWYGDYLIFLPQFPDFFDREGAGALFALRREDVEAYLEGRTEAPLEPVAIPFVAPDLREQIGGFEGFEAITFEGDRAYLTIEAGGKAGFRAYLVTGTMAPDLSRFTLEASTLVEIEAQSRVGNMSEEAIVLAGSELYTLYEANGTGVNAAPVAHRFSTTLAPRGTVAFPNVEYRITDATSLDASGRCWAINYFYPGEQELLASKDPIADRYGRGQTHLSYQAVERLVELQLDEDGFVLTDTAPIQLKLEVATGRNWEGLARLGERGFLIISDRFPGTIFGFVAHPARP